MAARRCSPCGRNWPVATQGVKAWPDFLKCPECGENTDWLNSAAPMDNSEVNHRVFDAFYAKREKDRIVALEAAVEAAPSIPDPPGAADLERLPTPKKKG